MKIFVALCRRWLANRFIRNLFVASAVYGLYLIYVGVNYSVVPHGLDDPVHRFTGIARIDQIISVSVVFGIIVMTMLAQHIAHKGRPLDFVQNIATRRGTILLVVLIFLNGVAASLAAVLNELNSQFWAPLFAWVAVGLALQVLIVYAAFSRLGQPRTHLVLMAALSVFNLFALYLSLLSSFQGLSLTIRAAILAFALLCFGVLFAAVGKRIVPLRGVNSVLMAMLIGPISGIILSSPAAPPTAKHLAPFNDIEFRIKPNIHIVSVDALSPAALVQKHMGLSDLPYARLLESDGVVVFKNAFASQVATTQSLNSLMRLAHPDFAGEFGYFAGRSNGPVAHILHANGYNISTGFDQPYFGNKGPFVDYYPPPDQAINSTLCKLASDNQFKFFGFCVLARLVAGPNYRELWSARVVDIVRQSADAPGAAPAFTLHYIFNPIGHYLSYYRSSDREARERYAAQYHDGAARITGIMERLQTAVRDDPAPSMLIVMGDHGPFLSRTVSVEDDPTFVVQDQHGILAAVLFNDTACTTEQLQNYTVTFATPERILAGVFRCLARDPARLDAAMKFDEAYEFKNFLYE